MDEEEEMDCEDAYENPKCPYVTVINSSCSDIKTIKVALVGNDFQGGLVNRIGEMEAQMDNLIRILKYLLGIGTPILITILIAWISGFI